ncbi:DUF4255 domain-containing protein [Halalkalicoccus salilacus]|uniref:DUF4255 domain-containing protein n=1 Tax=Halalkalicoccus salilacus TaxID=3117459 RepID=UPI00300E7AC1
MSETLVQLLRDRMGPLLTAPREVAATSPSEAGNGDTYRLTFFLYRVAQNSHLANAKRQPIGTDVVTRPPLALDLYYLLTAYPFGEEGDRIVNQQRVLGRAVQVLADNTVLEGNDLEGSLADRWKLHVSMNTLSDESSDEVLSIWNTFNETPYQPSVSYLVTPVPIDSTDEIPVDRVKEREVHYERITDRRRSEGE